MNAAEMLEQFQAIGEEPTEVPQRKPFDVNAFMAETNGMLFEHFRKLGMFPVCPYDRTQLALAGLPCAMPPVLPTPQGMQMVPGAPSVVVLPMACGKCGFVLYLSAEVVRQGAASPLVKL